VGRDRKQGGIGNVAVYVPSYERGWSFQERGKPSRGGKYRKKKEKKFGCLVGPLAGRVSERGVGVL